MCILFKRTYCPKLICLLILNNVPKNVLGSDFQFVSVLRKSAITKLLAKEGEMKLQSIESGEPVKERKGFSFGLYFIILNITPYKIC